MTQSSEVGKAGKRRERARPKLPPAAPEPPPPNPKSEAGGAMTFWEHLEELRRRLVFCVVAFIGGCIVAWEVKERMLDTLWLPFAAAWRAQGIPGDPRLNFAAPSATFVAYVKLSMIGGAALAAPIIFYQLWSFIAPGLYAKEKKFVIPFAFFSSVLFVGGGFFGWSAAFPITFKYFLSMSGSASSDHVMIMPTLMIGDYIDFVTQMLLCFGIVFEIPLFILFLSIAGIVNYLQLITWGRWYILIAFIVAAIVTPPDATSQLVMAIPMCLLYGLSIGLAFFFGKKPTEAQREAYRNRKKKQPDA